MSPEATIRTLREELEAVKAERDQYRRTVQGLMLKLFPPDPKRLEEEIRAVRENGIPFERVMEMIKARHGIPS
jgi:hypothetical protein